MVSKRNYKSLARAFEYELPIKISKEKGWFFAKCPVWPDCYAQGDTIENVISEITDVATGLIELYKEESLKIPLRKIPRTKTIHPQTVIKLPVLVSV